MFIIVVGINHKTAILEMREKLAFPRHEIPYILTEIKKCNAISGCVVLSTCNRMEIYAAATDEEAGIKSIHNFIQEYTKIDFSDKHHYFYSPACENAVRHLFRVAAGLDSMVLGESQILGQVRKAYQIACECDASNVVLNILFQRAITVGKRVRTETDIDKNSVSIGYTAVEKAKQIFGDLSGYSALIIGTGEISNLVAKHLIAGGVKNILISNRSYQKAQDLAKQFDGRAVKFENLTEHLEIADIVISCTSSPKHILSMGQMEKVMLNRNNRKIFMIDIAVPRDIDPQIRNLPGVSLLDIDDLKQVVDKNLKERKNEAVKAEKILEEEMDEFLNWINSLFVIPTIMALKDKGKKIKERELARAFNKLGDLSSKQERAISSLADSIVNSLLHDPVVNLKNYAGTSRGHLYLELTQKLFKLEVESHWEKPENNLEQKPG